MVLARQLDEPRVRQVLGEPAPVADVDEPVAAAVKDERRNMDARDHVAYVDVEEHLERATASIPGLALERSSRPKKARESGLSAWLGAANSIDAPCPQYGATSSVPASISASAGVRPRIVVVGRGARHAAVADERLRAVRIRGREQDAHRDALRDPEQRRPLRARGVHHGTYVVHALLERRRLRHRIRQSRAPPVEVDHPGERREAVEEPRRRLVLPDQLDVREIPVDQDQIEVALAEHLVGDVEVAALRVPGS